VSIEVVGDLEFKLTDQFVLRANGVSNTYLLLNVGGKLYINYYTFSTYCML